MIKETIMIMAIISIGTTFIGANVYAQDIVNTMEIQRNCSLTVGSSLDFETVAEDIITEEEILDLENSGGTLGTISVMGTNWVDDNDRITNVINGELTKFATSDLLADSDYDNKVALNSTNTWIEMGTIAASSTNSTYWQVLTTLNNVDFDGSISQTITFGLDC